MYWNEVRIAGNITKDIELRSTGSGLPVVGFSIAINGKGKDGQEQTDFIDCCAFGKTAENIARYFRRGEAIFLAGRLHQERWEKDGRKNSKLGVVVNTFCFCGGRGGGGTGDLPSPSPLPPSPADDIPF